MEASFRGINLIKQWEQFRSDWYQCSAGVWTIGYGHTEARRDGQITDEDLPDGMSAPITESEGEWLLHRDIEWFEKRVNELVTVELTQNQFDALVSFAYNVGTGSKGFSGSTLLSRLNAGSYEGAARELVRETPGGVQGWIYANGKKLKGLIRRRQAEKALFLEEVEQAFDIEPEPIDPLPVQMIPDTRVDPAQYPIREVTP